MNIGKTGLERAYWLAWSQIKDVGPVLIKRLHERFGSLELAWRAKAADLLSVDGIGLVTADRIVGRRSQLDPSRLLKQYEAKYPNFWTPADTDYPKLLWEIPDPPPLLYYRGPWRPNHHTTITIGIVGTRRPSPYGRRWTQRLSRCLSQHHMTIVSGLAAGIDAHAHQSCLNSGGQTIAVLGTGVDVVYPRNNVELYQRILETGLIVSEYPDGTPPDRGHFPRRNRIIAGLSHATLVTEAPERSGALITAYLANDYGRQVYALPAGLDNPTARGCLTLLNSGAAMVLGEDNLLTELTSTIMPETLQIPKIPDASPEDLHSSHPATAQSMDPKTPLESTEVPKEVPKLDEALQAIFQKVSHEPTTLDKLQEATQLDTSTLLSGLLQLELAGLIVQLPGGQYQRQ